MGEVYRAKDTRYFDNNRPSLAVLLYSLPDFFDGSASVPGGGNMNKHNSILRLLLAAWIVALLAPLASAQLGHTSKETTTTQFLNPEGLSKPKGFTHVVVAQPGKLVFISGQTARNATGDIVGRGDLRAQVTQVMENLKTALAAAGATTKDLIKVNYYVVNLKDDQVSIIREVRSKYLSEKNPPASTLIGVPALNQEGLMIEIEAVAIMR